MVMATSVRAAVPKETPGNPIQDPVPAQAGLVGFFSGLGGRDAYCGAAAAIPIMTEPSVLINMFRRYVMVFVPRPVIACPHWLGDRNDSKVLGPQHKTQADVF